MKRAFLLVLTVLCLCLTACAQPQVQRTDILILGKTVGYFESDVVNKKITEIRVCSNDGTVLYNITKENEDDIIYNHAIEEIESYNFQVVSGDVIKAYHFVGVTLSYVSYKENNKTTKYEIYQLGEKIWETTVSVLDEGRYISVIPRSKIDNSEVEFTNVTVNEYSADDVLISELALNQDFSLKKYTEYLYDENFVKIGNVRFDENKKRINYYIDEYIDEYDASKGGEGGTHTLKTLNGYELGTATWDDTGKMTESNITAK